MKEPLVKMPKVIALQPGWKPSQDLVDKLAGMNREQRRAWTKKRKNRLGR